MYYNNDIMIDATSIFMVAMIFITIGTISDTNLLFTQGLAWVHMVVWPRCTSNVPVVDQGYT